MSKIKLHVNTFIFILLITINAYVISANGNIGNIQSSNESTKIALHIYFYDDIAFDKSTQDLFENLFKKLRPDLIYKRISISSGRFEGNKEQVVAELKDKIANAVGASEKMTFLLIDTHATTFKVSPNEYATQLAYLGNVFESGTDSEMDEIFLPIKYKAEKNLQIILNSCTTFCGNMESAVKRGNALLNYFGAIDGGIYGTDLLEVSQSFDYLEFIKWQYFKPTLKMFIMMTVTWAVIAFPFASYDVIKDFSHQLQTADIMLQAISNSFFNLVYKTAETAVVMGSVSTILKPIFHIIGSKFLNRGYYFAFKNGKLATATKLIKRKDIKRWISNGTPIMSCQALFL